MVNIVDHTWPWFTIWLNRTPRKPWLNHCFWVWFNNMVNHGQPYCFTIVNHMVESYPKKPWFNHGILVGTPVRLRGSADRHLWADRWRAGVYHKRCVGSDEHLRSESDQQDYRGCHNTPRYLPTPVWTASCRVSSSTRENRYLHQRLSHADSNNQQGDISESVKQLNYRTKK